MHLQLYPYWREYAKQSNEEKGQCFQQEKKPKQLSCMNFVKYHRDALPLCDFTTYVKPRSLILSYYVEIPVLEVLDLGS